MKWAIYILILAMAIAHYIIEWRKLEEKRMEFSATSFIELSKINPIMMHPVQSKETD